MEQTYLDFVKKKQKANISHKYLCLQTVLQCSIKKGKKNVAEKLFRKMVFYMAQDKKKFKQNPWHTVMQGIYNLTPQVGIKVIRTRRKVLYKLKFITLKKQSYLVYYWLIKSLKNNNNNFHKTMALELKEASKKRGSAFNKNKEYYNFLKKNVYIHMFFKK